MVFVDIIVPSFRPIGVTLFSVSCSMVYPYVLPILVLAFRFVNMYISTIDELRLT
jgi:hypothetical protein